MRNRESPTPEIERVVDELVKRSRTPLVELMQFDHFGGPVHPADDDPPIWMTRTREFSRTMTSPAHVRVWIAPHTSRVDAVRRLREIADAVEHWHEWPPGTIEYDPLGQRDPVSTPYGEAITVPDGARVTIAVPLP